MITKETPLRIAQLGQTIKDASLEMEQLFRELSVEADAQMAAAARAFLIEHADTSKGPIYHSYAKAHEALLLAAVPAANIRDMSQRATTMRSKCSWWAPDERGRIPQSGDIKRVCDNVGEPVDAAAKQS